MPTYIVLGKFTEKAVQELKGQPDRIKNLRNRVEAGAGGSSAGI